MTEDHKVQRNDAEMLRVITPLMFGFADKTFKFVSWLIIIAAVQFAAGVTDSAGLGLLSIFLSIVYSLTLFLVAMELPFKGVPKSPYVPTILRWAVSVGLIILGFGLLMLMILPGPNGYPFVDQILVDLKTSSSR